MLPEAPAGMLLTWMPNCVATLGVDPPEEDTTSVTARQLLVSAVPALTEFQDISQEFPGFCSNGMAPVVQLVEDANELSMYIHMVMTMLLKSWGDP